jgi:hypothetical protein
MCKLCEILGAVPHPDLDNSARVKELGAENARLQAELGFVNEQRDAWMSEAKSEQAKRHEMGKRMRTLIVEAYKNGSSSGPHISSTVTMKEKSEEYADRIMKGEGNG